MATLHYLSDPKMYFFYQTNPIVKLMYHKSKLQVNMQSGELAMLGTIITYIS